MRIAAGLVAGLPGLLDRGEAPMFPRGIWKVAWLLLLAALAAIAFSAVVVDMTDGKKRFGKLAAAPSLWRRRRGRSSR